MEGKADREFVNDYRPKRNEIPADAPAEAPAEPLELRLQCLTYDERINVLPVLTEAIDRAGAPGAVLKPVRAGVHARTAP